MKWRNFAANSAGILLSVLLSLTLAACGGGGSSAPAAAGSPPPPSPPPPPPPPPAPTSLAGYWYVQSSVDPQLCGQTPFLDAWVADIVQTGGVIDLLTSLEDSFSGTVNGDTVSYTGSHMIRDPGSVFGSSNVDINSLTLTLSAGGDTMSGSATWTMNDIGSPNCTGTTEIFASRNSAVSEIEPNNVQANAQMLDIILNDIGVPQLSTVAFVDGSVDLATDEFDAFRIQIGSTATLEIELSHFDTTNEDLDLTLYDANLNAIDFSFFGSNYEYISVDLFPGTYYILVEAFDTPGPADYKMSVDLNP